MNGSGILNEAVFLKESNSMEVIMILNRIIWLVTFVGGIILLVYGIFASESFASDVSRLFSGTPSDKSMWLIIGGTLVAMFGLFGLTRKQSGKL